MNQIQFINMVLSWERSLEDEKQNYHRSQSNPKLMHQSLTDIKECVAEIFKHPETKQNRKPVYHY